MLDALGFALVSMLCLEYQSHRVSMTLPGLQGEALDVLAAMAEIEVSSFCSRIWPLLALKCTGQKICFAC